MLCKAAKCMVPLTVRRYVRHVTGISSVGMEKLEFQSLESQAKEVCESPLRAAVVLQQNEDLKERLFKTAEILEAERRSAKNELLLAKSELLLEVCKGKDEATESLLAWKDNETVLKQKLSHTQLLTSKIFQRYEFRSVE